MPGKPMVDKGLKPKEAFDKLLTKAGEKKTEKHVEANEPIIEVEPPKEAAEERAEGAAHVPIETPELEHGRRAYLAFTR